MFLRRWRAGFGKLFATLIYLSETAVDLKLILTLFIESLDHIVTSNVIAIKHR